MKFIALVALSLLVASTFATGLTDCYWSGVVQYCYYNGELGVVVPSADPDSGVDSYAACYTKVGKIICLNDGDDKVVWYEGTDAASVASTATINDYYTIYESATTTNAYYASVLSAKSASASTHSGSSASSSSTDTTTASTASASSDSTANSSTSSSTSTDASSSASSSAGSGAVIGVPSALAALLAVGLASLY